MRTLQLLASSFQIAIFVLALWLFMAQAHQPEQNIGEPNSTTHRVVIAGEQP